MTTVNVFYAPELENPPLAPECSITFSFIGKENGTTEAIRIRDGLNNIDEDTWEKIQEKEYAQRLLSQGALRIMGEQEVKQTLEDEDLKVPESVSIAKLTVADASKVVSSMHDLQKLDALLQDEKRIPVRQAITRRINTLSGGD